ncbi:MAG TPA: hypothetical protein VMW73_14320 [Spirochaetia bacterium]|nr:hypothetical protein [Spirochaetia bacterium]
MTIKDYNDRPETRVFRLDTECYIVFLGSNGNDYKPFLRIGNTQDLPQTVIANTQNIVITDRLTGNPALETANIFDMYLDEIRYLGDPDLVDHFKTFVRKANLHVQAFDAYTGQEESNANASYVYFYTDGNMSVYFGRNKIFNLRDRERFDGHFIERAKRIRSLFIKNQLRYRPEDFRGPGFIIVDGVVDYFQEGRIVAPSLSASFFKAYAEVGVDPDNLHIVFSDSLSESLVDLLKRKRSKQDQVIVVTTNPELVSTAAELFSIKKQEALDAKVIDFTSGSCEVEDLTLRRTPAGLAVSFKGLGITMQPAGTAPAGPSDRRSGDETGIMSIDPRSGTVTLQRGRHVLQQKVLLNTPHAVREAIPDTASLFHRYFELTLPFYTDLLSAEHGAVVKSVHDAVSGMLQGKDAGQLKQADARLRDLSTPLHPYVRNFLITAESALRLMKNGEGGASPVRTAGGLAGTISRVVHDDVNSVSPDYFVGEIVAGRDDMYLFYRPAKVNVTQNQVETAALLTRRIQEEGATENAIFSSERERLLSLIQELDIPQSRRGPGPAQAAADEKARAEKQQAQEKSMAESAAAADERRRAAAAGQPAGSRDQSQKPGETAARPSETQKKTPAAAPSGSGAAAHSRGSDTSVSERSLSAPTIAPHRGRSSRRSWRVPAAIAASVILIVGALLFFLLRNGRPAKPGSVAQTGANGSSQSAATSSGQSSGTAAAAADNSSTEQTSPAASTANGAAGGAQTTTAQSGQRSGTTSGSNSAPSNGGSPAGTAQSGSTAGNAGTATTANGSGNSTNAGAGNTATTQPATSAPAQQPPAATQAANGTAAAPAASAAGGTATPNAGSATPGTGNAAAATQAAGSASLGSLYIDGIRITIGDIVGLTNSIATANGLANTTAQDLAIGNNPSWIQRGKVFILPDGSRYTVKEGDTVWTVTVNYIRNKLDAALRKYHALLMQYGLEHRIVPIEYRLRRELIAALGTLPDGVYSENFTRMIQGMINEMESA